MYDLPDADSCIAAARRKRALTPYFLSAAMKATPSAGSDVFAFRYSSMAHADAPLTDKRFVSRVIAPPAWYFRARGMRASAVGTAKVTSNARASGPSMKGGRRMGARVSRVGVRAPAPDDP